MQEPIKDSASKVYAAAADAAQEVYVKAMDAAWRVYDETRAPAWKVYGETRDTALRSMERSKPRISVTLNDKPMPEMTSAEIQGRRGEQHGY